MLCNISSEVLMPTSGKKALTVFRLNLISLIYGSPCLRESGFQFFLVESGILGFGILKTAQGIRNPTKDWNPESKFH